LLDVANLGWKLAATVRGHAPEGLLDTYHAERHPVGQRVVMHSQAQSALLAPGASVTALRELFGELLAVPDNAHRIAALLAGSDVRYGSGMHPLVGSFVPDFPLTVEGRATRLAELARTARPLLVDLTGGFATDLGDNVDVVAGKAEHPPAEAMLIRPDGYAVWAGTDRAGLAAAARAWFG
jgi:hypothetical protein